MVDGIDLRSVWILFLLSFICIWFQEKGISHYRSWDPEFWPVWYRTSIWCGWEEDWKTKFHRFVKLKINPLQFGVSVWGSVLSWIKEKYVIFDSHTIFQSFKNVHFTWYLLPTLFTWYAPCFSAKWWELLFDAFLSIWVSWVWISLEYFNC